MPTGYKGKIPATCHPNRDHFAKGLCKVCYYKPYIKRRKSEGVVPPSHSKENKRRDHLKPLGWTLERFNEAINNQKGKCAICEKVLNLDPVQNGARACADHEHTIPPKPRKVLCTNCNAMIGQAKENPSTLIAGAFYLEEFLLVNQQKKEKSLNSIHHRVGKRENNGTTNSIACRIDLS